MVQILKNQILIFFSVGNSISEVEKHLMSQHEEEYLDDENWFEIDDNAIPRRIREPKRGFLYLFMMDEPKDDSSTTEDPF